MASQTKQVDAKVGIDVTLNGGKKEMNSATIPIEWWLSKEVIETDPHYIIFFEQNQGEKNHGYRNGECGRRYACKVTDAFKYIQLFSPGYHRVMVVAVRGKNEEDAKQRVQKYLSKEYRYQYDMSLSWEQAEHNDLQSRDWYLVASTVEEFEVPEELFARKPETKTSKLVWKWANLWFDSDPIDECDYRRRKILAFTLQPPLMAIFQLLRRIVGIGYSLYILLASLATLFVGYRPRPIFKEMWMAFKFDRYAEWGVRKYDHHDVPYGKSVYRLWSVERVEGEHGYKDELKYMPIAPIQIFLLAVSAAGVYLLVKFLPPDIWRIVLGIAAAVGFVALVVYGFFKYLDKTSPERKEKRRLEAEAAEKERVTQQELMRKWMLENFDLSKKTNEVDLTRIPVPLDFQGKVVQKFRVNYWTLKAKICKPFSK